MKKDFEFHATQAAMLLFSNELAMNQRAQYGKRIHQKSYVFCCEF